MDDLKSDGKRSGAPKGETTAVAATETIEEWARRKGMFNRFQTGEREAFQIPNPAYQDFAQARAYSAWAPGTRVTEEEFDAAVKAAKSHDYR